MVLSSKETQNKEFWRQRLRESSEPRFAIAASGFDWDGINNIHTKIIFKYVKKADKVLDVACGIGRIVHWFDDYVGIDFLEEFIEIARKENPDKRFLVCDITRKLPFKSKEFDWAILISVKKVIEPVIGKDKWAKVEKELKRVTKGIIILEYGDNKPENIYNSVEIICPAH